MSNVAKRRRPLNANQALNLVLKNVNASVHPPQSSSAANNPSPFAQAQHGGGFQPAGRIPLTSDAVMQSSALQNNFMDFSDLSMKPNPDDFPALVCPNGYIFLEVDHAVGKYAVEFIVAIAEPASRPEMIHEFQITVFSLYAALSMGLTVDDLLRRLNSYSKNIIPESLIGEIRKHGGSFGRVKLVLRDRKYFIESSYRDDLELLAANPVIASARIHNTLTMRTNHDAAKTDQIAAVTIPSASTAPAASGDDSESDALKTAAALSQLLGEDIDPDTAALLHSQDVTENMVSAPPVEQQERPLGIHTKPRKGDAVTSDLVSSDKKPEVVYSFQVEENRVGAIKEVALRSLGRPLLTEYDFLRDASNPSLNISLTQDTHIRYYQERALRKMFSSGRARSGIIVLPCGAGKTLTGITAASTIKKSTMVLTSSSVAVDQWRRSFLEFTTVDPKRVVVLTADTKSDLPEGACVVCSTYTMMSYSGKRSEVSERIMSQIQKKDWGLLIFDEVQFAPAPAFRRINDICRSHCKIGLTATLVREDDLINDLQWLIGPKLDEANWLELQHGGYLAKAKCSEVWCDMTYEYFAAYINSSPNIQRRLWTCNPNKLRVCEYLIKFHQARKDKIIVFSDNLFALKEVAFALKAPYISGEVTLQERMVIINKFKTSPTCNVIFLSKVGDNAIDIPCANVVIQISFNFASRRQETQRLGRILRPKPRNGASASAYNEEFNAFFYSLVSKDTQEIAYADKRQQFIVDQGYAYKVLPMAVFNLDQQPLGSLIFDDPERQKTMLQRILVAQDNRGDLEEDDVVLSAAPP